MGGVQRVPDAFEPAVPYLRAGSGRDNRIIARCRSAARLLY
ncbi:MAG TPA: hypothetical protein VFS21_32160 [Roseiflexaceae bacterium]|nr:hypothetical protein [Roseiflexaceae bacterium]